MTMEIPVCLFVWKAGEKCEKCSGTVDTPTLQHAILVTPSNSVMTQPACTSQQSYNYPTITKTPGEKFHLQH